MAGRPVARDPCLATQQFAGMIESINYLNLTPDLLGSTFQQLLRD